MPASTKWLSRRVRSKVDLMLPQISGALADRDRCSNLDLATAENHLIRAELVELCKEIINEKLAPDALSYPSGFSGEPYLLHSLANFFNRYFEPHVHVDAGHIVAGPGATACLTSLLFSICDAGDAVIVPEFYWNGFDIHFSLQPAVDIINVDPGRDAGDEMDADLLTCLQQSTDAAELWGKKVRAVVLTNPQNPSGRCYSLRALQSTARFCEERDIHLIADEVFALSRLQPGPKERFSSVLALDLNSLGVNPARVHVIWSTSKDFGSSGYRLGCVVSQANDAVRASIGLMTTTQVSSLAALVTAELLEHPHLPWLIGLNSQRLAAAYDHVTTWLNKHEFPFIPATAGVYVLARLAPHAKTWAQESEVVAKLKAVGVLVSPGRSFHLRENQKGWCRIVIAVKPDILHEALRRMERALELRDIASTQPLS